MTYYDLNNYFQSHTTTNEFIANVSNGRWFSYTVGLNDVSKFIHILVLNSLLGLVCWSLRLCHSNGHIETRIRLTEKITITCIHVTHTDTHTQ